MARLENLIGAHALHVVDRMQRAGARLGTDSERAALTTLLAHPGTTVNRLADVLGLTGSGATRLVARMVSEGTVESAPGADARSRQLRLTTAGRRRARSVLAARGAEVADLVAPLSAEDRATLEGLLDRLVAGSAEDRPAALRVCRWCDRGACAAESAECPLEHTTRAVAHD